MTHDIYYMRTLTNPATSTPTITPEGQPINTGFGSAGEVNMAVKLNTDDSGDAYEKNYPTWSPFLSIFSIAYASNRSVTYNDPNTRVPLEVAASIPQNGAYPGGGTVGPNYTGILQSLVLDLDPPTLLPFNASEEIHVNAAGTSTATPVLGTNGAVHFINPSPVGGSSYVTFTVRLSRPRGRHLRYGRQRPAGRLPPGQGPRQQVPGLAESGTQGLRQGRPVL